MQERYLTKHVLKDLEANKMVFIAGPRQSGKTTLAKSISLNFKSSEYLNWDAENDRRQIVKSKIPDTELIIFDELHKFPRWKNFLKGYFDTRPKNQKIIVTGSARLDVYRRGGDSMLGRYFLWHLHPLCLAELKSAGLDSPENFSQILKYGGFPESFFKKNMQFTNRWRTMRFEQILREDLRDLEKIQEIELVKILADLLRERVSQEVVIKNLAEDLQVAHLTVKRWIAVLEKLYLGFQSSPYTKKIARAIHKSQRFYYFDNGDVRGDSGAVFENLVATHLYKKLQYLQDSTGDAYELKFIRDREKREVDFVIVKNRQPLMLLEAKNTDTDISNGLKYYQKKLNLPAYQVVGDLKRAYQKNSIHVVSADQFLRLDLDHLPE